MVPTAFVSLDRLPLTANGKVDRRALPPLSETIAEAAPDAHRSSTLSRIAALVAEVLQAESLDPEVNLLSYGANSIDMVRIGNKMESEFGFRPRMDQLFRLQTISALARYCDQHATKRVEANQPGQQPTKDIEALISSYRVMLDPAEREKFKDAQPGIRPTPDQGEFIQLIGLPNDDHLIRRYTERRSHRNFALKPIFLEEFSQFLSCLYQIRMNGKVKYLYASPGGLYPTQTYLHVKPGRVEGISAGTYYYHAVDHRLVLLSANAEIDRNIHIPFINTPIFDEAAFSIFLVAQLSAIAPAYGDRSMHFVTLEAGIIAHLLEVAAPASGIGLCQIGSIDFERIRHLFKLEDTHVLVHSLVGGPIDDNRSAIEEKADGRPDDAEKAAKLLERIKRLSKDEVKALLNANRASDLD
jgi:SagB-type dehydrogenase family enzyme